MTTNNTIIQVNNIVKEYISNKGLIFSKDIIYAVNDVSFDLLEKETIGIVGESGCGKTTLAKCILRLIEPTKGSVFFQGQDICKLPSAKFRQTRKDMQIIFQDPYSSLNPRMKVGRIIREPFEIHSIIRGKDVDAQVLELMNKVGLSPKSFARYPREFSGGQRQRIAIARAIALKPKLVICDEPVSALDVSIQSQILNLLVDLQNDFGISYIFISHDLNVIRFISKKIAVMYLGKIVEYGEKEAIFKNPLHPYTQILISSIPSHYNIHNSKKERIKGELPDPSNPPSGCFFNTRCPYKMDICLKDEPILKEYTNKIKAACHLYN